VHDLAAYREAVTGERERMSALELVGRGRNPRHEQSIGTERESEVSRRPESGRQQREKAPSHDLDQGYGFDR
jgi:hypothetical protein